MSESVDGNRPPSPLVRQLKQKFDRMAEHTLQSDAMKYHSQTQMTIPKTARVGHAEHDGAYPLLPVCCFALLLVHFFLNIVHHFPL